MAKNSDSPNPDLEIRCPCCGTMLVVEAGSGEILYEERPRTPGRSWGEAMRAGRVKLSEAETMFEKGIEREKNSDLLLEKKFREAMRRADKSDTPPPRPFDLD